MIDKTPFAVGKLVSTNVSVKDLPKDCKIAGKRFNELAIIGHSSIEYQFDRMGFRILLKVGGSHEVIISWFNPKMKKELVPNPHIPSWEGRPDNIPNGWK